MRRKAQVTLFVIIALIIITIVLVFIFLNSRETKIDPEFIPVEDYIHSCIKETSIEGINYIFLQGGYYEIKGNSLDFMFLKIPYYFYNEKSQVPSKDTLENELAKYINKRLEECINNFNSSALQDYEIKQGEVKTDVKFSEKTSVNVDWRISVTKNQKTIELKDFHQELEFNFDKIYNLLKLFEEEHQKNKNSVPVAYQMALAEKNDFKFKLSYPAEGITVYTWIFEDYFYNNLVINFAGKYNWGELYSFENSSLEINTIPRQNAYEGKEFYFKVEAEGDNVQFTDYTDLFEINKIRGEIKFIPENIESGPYNILIKAHDSKGNEDYETMVLDIVKDISQVNFNKTENEI